MKSLINPCKYMVQQGFLNGPRCQVCTQGQRTLRYADGPEEVHHHVICARAEVKAFKDSNSRQADTKQATSRLMTGGK